MTVVGTTRVTSIHRRMCVRCGYDGRGVREGVFRHSDAWCPNCGCDFRRRPPLSYAEMEGLYDEPFLSVEQKLPSPARARKCRKQLLRRLERCLAAIFAAIISTLVAGQLVYLGFSVMD